MNRLLLITGLTVSFLAPVSLSAEPSDVYDRGRTRYLSARKLPASPLRHQELTQAASDLREFLDRFPSHEKGVEARFNLGSIFRDLAKEENDREAASRALHYFRELTATAPRHRLADDAWLAIAEICKDIFADLRCSEEARAKSSATSTVSSGKGEVRGVRLERGASTSLVRVTLNRPHPFTAKSLPADPAKGLPRRFYIDIEQATISADASVPVLMKEDVVTQFRFGTRDENILRLVLDLREGLDDSVVVTARSEGSDILLSIGSDTPVEPVVASATPIAIASPAPTSAPSAPEPITSVKRTLTRKVVIDAGHGGEDTGARGKRGTLEKNVCLDMALKVESLLRQKGGYEIFLTRREDLYIPLAERTRMANHFGGDLFVSIHANASPKRTAEGVSTYFLDNADDDESLRVAMRENEELRPEVRPKGAKDEAYYLEVMKASLLKNFQTTLSTDLARLVQTSLVDRLKPNYRDIQNLGVRSARFYVLTGANMPAVLVETSFISNPKEEQRLRNRSYQKLLADAIAQAIERFFKNSTDHAALYRP